MKWQPGAQRSEATGPNRGEIRSLRCAPFPTAIIIIGELVDGPYPVLDELRLEFIVHINKFLLNRMGKF